MSGLACVACKKFFRPLKNGAIIEEGMPLDDLPVGDPNRRWGPYKLWRCDLAQCPGCGAVVATGFANHNFAEHFEPNYAEVRAAHDVVCRVDDCGGYMP